MSKKVVAFKTSADTLVTLEFQPVSNDHDYTSMCGNIYQRGTTTHNDAISYLMETLKDALQDGDEGLLDRIEGESLEDIAENEVALEGLCDLMDYEDYNDDDDDNIVYVQAASAGQCDEDINDLVKDSKLLTDTQKHAWKTVQDYWRVNHLSNKKVNNTKVIAALDELDSGQDEMDIMAKMVGNLN